VGVAAYANAMSVLSSDSDLSSPMKALATSMRANMPGTALEFERLMRDSPGSDTGNCNTGEMISPDCAARGSSHLVLKMPRLPDSLRHPLQSSSDVQTKAPVPITAQTASSSLASPNSAHVGGHTNSTTDMGCHISACESEPSVVPMPTSELEQEDIWARSALSSRLDDISREMRRIVEHEFLLAERAMLARHKANLEAHRLQAEAAACQQQLVVESLQSDKQHLVRQVDMKQRQLKGSIMFLMRARGTLAGRYALELSLRAWSATTAASKDARLQTLLTTRICLIRLRSIAFNTWRRKAQEQHREAVVLHERAVAESVRCKLVEQMEVERKRMADEMEQLTRKLLEESQQRTLLQENLRRVFMRGVCALNFEAMSLLADPSASGGGGNSGSSAMSNGLFATNLDLNNFSGVSDAPIHSASQKPIVSELPVKTMDSESAGCGKSAVCAAVQEPAVLPDVGISGDPGSAEPLAAVRNNATAETAVVASDCSTVQQIPTLQNPVIPASSAARNSVPEGASGVEGPRQAPVPLPFVSYSGLDKDSAPSKPVPRQATPTGAPPKGLRWQSAPAPRGGVTSTQRARMR